MNPDRIYAVLLGLYPKTFRQRYGAEMIETFRDLYRHGQSGRRFWSFLIYDTCRAALVQHIDRWTSDDRRVAFRWLLACAGGAVLCDAVGTALMWSFGYLYHPFLEGARVIPSIYGAVLGAALGSMQSLMFTRVGERTIWILVSAASTAAGLELALSLAPVIGLLGYGVVVGSIIASAQWLALRGRMKRPSAAAFASALAVATAAIAGSIAVSQASAGFNALRPTIVASNPAGVNGLLRGVYAPMNVSECVLAIASMAIAGLILGAITVKPASTFLGSRSLSEAR
jgi:hypothetical protein